MYRKYEAIFQGPVNIKKSNMTRENNRVILSAGYLVCKESPCLDTEQYVHFKLDLNWLIRLRVLSITALETFISNLRICNLSHYLNLLYVHCSCLLFVANLISGLCNEVMLFSG